MKSIRFFITMCFVVLAGCGGSGGGGSSAYDISGTLTSNGVGLAGVTISLAEGTTTTTDSNGNYRFSGIANGNYTVTPSGASYEFSPITIPITVAGANISGTNFIASNDITSLPANLLTQAASSNCAALRSGTYNQILLVPDSPDFPDKIGRFSVDAAANAWSDSTGGGTFFSAGESCHYTMSGGTEFVVSPAGIMVGRFGRTATKYLAIDLPAQTFTLAELAGTWNILGMDSTNPGIYDGTAMTATFNSTGVITAAIRCRNAVTWDVTSCIDATSGQPTLRANSDGGFDVLDSTNTVMGRMFAYKAGNGDVMGVTVTTIGTYYLSTKQRTNSLPIVGAMTTNWNLVMDSVLTSPSEISEFSNTIVSTDSTTGSWTRSQKTVGGTDGHPETLFANTPRNGYTFRPAGTALAVDGTTVTFGEFTSLPLRGMGVSALLYPAQKRFSLSVAQP